MSEKPNNSRAYMLHQLVHQLLQSTVSSGSTKYLPKRTNDGNSMCDDLSNVTNFQENLVSQSKYIDDSRRNLRLLSEGKETGVGKRKRIKRRVKA